MRLNRQTDYAFRLLMYCGVRPEHELTTIKEVSALYDISDTHLMKVVRKLGQAGFLETVRGRQGGFRLGKPTDQIRLGDVVRAMEEDLALVQCLEGGAAATACRIAGPCRLVGVLGEALSAFLEVLDRYTLADLTAPASGLAAFLGVDGGETVSP